MGYDHITVKGVIAHTQDVLERVKKSRLMTDPPDKIRPDAFRWFNGIPIRNEVYAYMMSLRKEIPSVEFGLQGSIKAKTINIVDDGIYEIRVVSEMYAYLPDDEFVLGKIGYWDYCTTRAKNGSPRPESYMVQSQHVRNTKYDEYRDQYTMLMSKDMNVAIDNAKKYLRQYSPVDLIKAVAHKVSDNVGQFRYKKRRARDEALRDMSDFDVVKELKQLVASGYEFSYPDVKERVIKVLMAADDFATLEHKKFGGKFITVSNQLGVQMFDVIPYDDALGTITPEWKGEGGVRYRADEMPQDLLGRVAVLSMAQHYDYIEGVGNRMGESMFWVEDEA